MCGCRVCVSVCAHSCLLVSMAAVDQALGTLEGAAPGQALGAEQSKWKVPLLSSPSLRPPTPRRAPEPFPVSPSSGHLAASRGVRSETTGCSCLSRKREPRSERPPCPGSMPASRELTEGKDKEASQGTPGPWVATSLHVQLPGAHPVPLHVSRAALHGGLLP